MPREGDPGPPPPRELPGFGASCHVTREHYQQEKANRAQGRPYGRKKRSAEPGAGEDVSPNSPNRDNKSAHRQSEHDSKPPVHHTIHEEVDRDLEEYERNRVADCIGEAAFPKRDAERVEKPGNGDRHEHDTENDSAGWPRHADTPYPSSSAYSFCKEVHQ